MNYAVKTDRKFITKKDITVKKPLSEEAKARREYIRNHKFSIFVDPSTKKAKIDIVDNSKENNE